MWRWAVYGAQFAVAWPVYMLLRLLPLDLAGRVVGRLGRMLGPRVGISRRARANLHRVFPELPASKVETIVAGMWENLFRVCVEYIHLEEFRADTARIEIVGGEIFDALQADGRPALLFSGHIANWEMATVAARRKGLDLSLVYRNLNNLIIDRYVREIQRSTGAHLLRKGTAGARAMIEELRRGGHVMMLVDQRLNSGISVPFFGRPAMTAPAIASLAYRFDAPLVPVRVERLGGARFRVTVEPPLDLPRGGDRHADVAAAMLLVNARLEDWIRARPEQWLWLHRRWPNQVPA